MNMENTKSTGFHILRYIILTGIYMMSWSAYAELGSTTVTAYAANMVKIKSTFRSAYGEQRGFGLIMLEKNDFLYVVTPKHVIEDKYAHSSQDNNAQYITVTLYKADQSIQAELINKHDRLDLALLKVRKPSGFTWNYAHLGGQVDKGDRVWVVGYDWQWIQKPDRRPIYVDYIDVTEIRASTSVKEGTSGGLLVANDFITGMILENIQDSGTITAYRFDLISNIVFEQWLNEELKPDSYDDLYPYVNLSVNLGMAVVLTSIDEKAPPFTYGVGFNIDYMAAKTWGIRYSHNEYNIGTKVEWPLSNESIRFRNDVSMDMLQVLIGDDVSNTPYFHQKHGSSYFYLGYGIGKHNPEVNINSSGWARLDDQPSFTENYSETFDLFVLGGIVSGPVSDNWTFGMDVGLMFTNDKYIAVDVNQPFDSNSVNDIFFYFNVNLGYSFGKPASAKRKILY